MKKLIVATALLALLGSCKDEEPIIPVPGSTININLRPERNVLLLTGYNLTDNATLDLVQRRIRVEDEFDNRLNHISFLGSGSDFYNPMIDSILAQLSPVPTIQSYVVNGELPLPGSTDYKDLRKVLAAEALKKPVASVGHTVFRDDTSWVVSSKVEFFEDTLVQPDVFKIETYMIADIQAKYFLPPVDEDLKFMNEKNVVANTPFQSNWAKNIPNRDTTAFIVANGDPIFHQYLFMGNSNPKDAFGTSLSSYWPFAGNFTKGDIIGTSSTPIYHHFPKLKAKEFDYERKISFVTVIWAFNPMTNVYDYVNSYMSSEQYTDE